MRFSTLAPEVRSENTYGLNVQFFSLAVSRLFATDRWRGFSGNYQYRYKQKISSGPSVAFQYISGSARHV